MKVQKVMQVSIKAHKQYLEQARPDERPKLVAQFQHVGANSRSTTTKCGCSSIMCGCNSIVPFTKPVNSLIFTRSQFIKTNEFTQNLMNICNQLIYMDIFVVAKVH
jgi:hypothetical protein